MPYKSVKRVVTVEFFEGPRRGDYDIRITPEQLVVRFGDTIVWDVQGLSAAAAKRVAFGVFVPLEVSPRLRLRQQSLLPSRLVPPSKQSIPVKAVGKRFLAVLDLKKTDVGFYKYDVECGNRTLRDPEIEIRGPRN
jgi:hypothetical protein